MKSAERNRKLIYRVIVNGNVSSRHKIYGLALKAEKRVKGTVHIERWSAKYGTWEKI